MSALFWHPAFLWGLGFLAVPIILQILFRMRYKRVRFAPIDFLLESQRRNRYRILLEQILLLLLRMALLAGIVILIARPTLGEHLGSLLAGDRQVEHFVLVDDSYSMGQNLGSGDCFDRAKEVVLRLARELSEQSGRHTLRVKFASQDGWLFESDKLDPQTLARLQALVESSEVSFSAAPPWSGLNRVVSLATTGDPTTARMLHLVSDFRQKDWAKPGDVLEQFQHLRGGEVLLHFVDAGGSSAANLTIATLESRSSAPAVGVTLPLVAKVQNFGIEPAQQVAVTIKVDGRPLPVRTIDSIPPGESVAIEESIRFGSIGPHEVRAEIGADALNADNVRHWVGDVLERQPVLIVDGSPNRADSRFLAMALSPGGSVRTGWAPQIGGPEALANADLSTYRSVLLVNLPSLEDATARKLTDYVRGGGGIAFFAGDQSQADMLNKLLSREATPLLPLPLTTIAQPADGLTRSRLSDDSESGAAAATPDFVPDQHPLFAIFAGDRNPFLEAVRVDQYFGVDEQAPLAPNAKVIARHRSGAPLVIDSTIGAGRVLWFLTTVGPQWNNWARNPSYVVTMLELQRYLAEPVGAAAAHYVGEPWSARFDAAKFRRSVTIDFPTADAARGEESIEAILDGTHAQLTFAGTRLPGVYRMVRTTAEGRRDVQSRAFNVDPAEGDLARIAPTDLASAWDGIDFRLETADQLTGGGANDRFDPRDLLLAGLVLVLVAEQLLAWRMSYHPKG